MLTYYHYTYKVISLTSKDNEAIKTLRLTRGVVKEVAITFPRGCAGLVGARIFRSTRQVIPENPVEWIVTDGETVIAPLTLDLTQEPYELELHAYNEDEVYNHTLRVRVSVETVAETAPYKTPEQESQELMSLLGFTPEGEIA